MKLPEKYAWLAEEPTPKALVEAIRHYGLLEKQGPGSNQEILRWAKEVGVSGWYTSDDIPWCGLFVGVVVKRAGYEVSKKLLSALSWLEWGNKVTKGNESLFDVLVFKRNGGGHVGFYVGENESSYLVYGGNQSDAVGFCWISKQRLVGCRRYQWKQKQPDNIRKILLNDSGTLSVNEA